MDGNVGNFGKAVREFEEVVVNVFIVLVIDVLPVVLNFSHCCIHFRRPQ